MFCKCDLTVIIDVWCELRMKIVVTYLIVNRTTFVLYIPSNLPWNLGRSAHIRPLAEFDSGQFLPKTENVGLYLIVPGTSAQRLIFIGAAQIFLTLRYLNFSFQI